jgi:tRNA threonylcarbamoyladenosine biosynthesis protein TsaB
MITLVIDTSEVRGSVALVSDSGTVSVRRHETGEDYSSWLLPVVNEVLAEAGVKLEVIDLLAVSTGPGSFTGLRVGLTAVKAWAEVYGKPVVGISRLEATARLDPFYSGYVAACYDAHRGQMFGGLYLLENGNLLRVKEEMVISPEGFLALVAERAGNSAVKWVSLDPELITNLKGWKDRAARGDSMGSCQPDLAGAIGRIAEERARKGEFNDALVLDANYVRRSDAEILWKEPATHAQ